jgi:hypothetical protein
MPATYEPIATTTLGTATATVTFSAIPATYTDLVIIFNGGATIGLSAVSLRFNGDTTTNYSVTRLNGDGTNATSGRDTSADSINSGLADLSNSTSIFNIFNYANSTTFKTVLGRGVALSFGVRQTVGLWRKSPETITSVLLAVAGTTFTAGSTFTLYGIKAA